MSDPSIIVVFKRGTTFEQTHYPPFDVRIGEVYSLDDNNESLKVLPRPKVVSGIIIAPNTRVVEGDVE